MIRRLFCDTLACLLLAFLPGACGKFVHETADTTSAPVSFHTPVVGVATKAGVTDEVIGVSYDTRESFRAFAAYSAGDFNSSNPSSYTEFFPSGGIACSWDSGVNAWKPASPYYWPYAGKLTFQAMSPADAGNNMTSLAHNWSSGFTFTGFQVPAAGSQYDLLYTDRIENRERAQYTSGDPYDETAGDQGDYNGIDLAFKHALCQVEFRFGHPMDEESSLKFWLTKIRILNAYSQGDFASSTPAWSNQATETNYQVCYFWDGDLERPAGTVPLNGSGAPVTLAGIQGVHTMMLLPQALDHGGGHHVKLEITYCYGTALSNTTPVTVTIDLVTGGAGNSYFKDTGGNDIDAWEIGKRYVYTLSIQATNLFQIFLDPSVSSSWTSANGNIDITN